MTVERPGRNVSVPNAGESWMDGLSAADVIRQYGSDPNCILTLMANLKRLAVKNISPYRRIVLTIHLVQMGVLQIHARVNEILPTEGSC